MQRLLTLTGVLAGLAGCSTVTGPDTRRVIGLDTRRVIGLIDAAGTGTPTIVAPDTVQAGSSFTATVHSFGSSCITPDGVELTLASTQARVTPYDRVPADNGIACPADFRPHPHPVELRFTSAGPATIVAQGRVFASSEGLTQGTVIKQLVVLER